MPRLDPLGTMTCAGRPLRLAAVALAALAGASELQAQAVACLPIRDIQVSGVQSLPQAAVEQSLAPLEGRCLGIAEFNQALKTVTDQYVEAGLITSRVYLPEQDLSDGILRIDVIEGRIERVEFNGAPDPLWERFTFPGIRGKVANLREIEQGLDNIRSMPSFYGTRMALDAGAAVGSSVLQVEAVADPKPWRLSVSTDNYGFADNGEFNPTLSLGWDNLIGINDRWDFSYSRAVDQTPFAIGRSGNSSEQAGFSVSVPYGNWAFSFNQSWSAYDTVLPGIVAPIDADGDSWETVLGARRLLTRDQDSMTHLRFDLTRNEKRNNVAGVRIDASSRVVTAIGAELSHQRRFMGGQLTGVARIEQGVKLFGAEDAGAQPDRQPDAQYSLISLRGNYDRSWQLDHGPGTALRWISAAELQYSKDRLYGDQRFQLGGNSTVRASKVLLAQGSSGIFWRNELWYYFSGATSDTMLSEWFGQPVVYAGLDAGRVFSQSDLDVFAGTAVGAVAGLRLVGGRLSLDLGYADMVSVSDGLQKPDGHVRVAVRLSF
ncbi:MAG: ShlB/FhaC/HecB family hemolysin secretion/activation protein [Paracoccaceae bacterium]